MEDKNKTIKPIIEAKNLSVVYNLGKPNELTALKDANIKIYPGEYIIIYGPSGCGKSTLLFAIAGLQTPSKGGVIADGVDLSKIGGGSKKMVDFHRNHIGIIFQSFHLISSLNVSRNIGLPQIFLGNSKKKREGKIKSLMERFGILNQAKKLPNQLSGGQKQRVAIARSLINDPSILLADEPVGNLDTKSTENVLQILKSLNEKEKRTIILVTHDSRHLGLANRVFHMKDGAIIKETVNEDVRPEKARVLQEMPNISQELELLMRTYSELSSSQLGSMLIPFKAKQLVQDVLIEMSNEQIKTIQKIVEEYLMNVHIEDYEIIEKTLDRPLEEGGAGLDKRTAERLSEKIQKVLTEVKYLKEQEKQAQSEYKVSASPQKIQHLRKFILEKYDIHITQEIIIKRLDKALEMRLKNEIDSAKLRQILDYPLNKGGTGLDKRNAKKIAREMELIMLLKFH
ncbi:ABC transporter ATP-binding protein [Candidatus Falkowbacteria bacterium]|jgi:putative ABC transport system ATP-binding protein|nr:ABC transporter ATP-binding protein [Candidatus Falkowbacteria bacterium]MBT4433432.1 ABC transporter ATP-binding protein [Candidatus Falkowbacteria bacterium]